MYELLRTIACHDDALSRAVEQTGQIYLRINCLILANYYNGFYRDCKVIQNGIVNQSYFAVSEVTSKLLESGMIGLGISPLEQM